MLMVMLVFADRLVKGFWLSCLFIFRIPSNRLIKLEERELLCDEKEEETREG